MITRLKDMLFVFLKIFPVFPTVNGMNRNFLNYGRLAPIFRNCNSKWTSL